MPKPTQPSRELIAAWLRTIAQQTGWRHASTRLWKRAQGFRLAIVLERSSWGDYYHILLNLYPPEGRTLGPSATLAAFTTALHRRFDLKPIERMLDFTNPLIHTPDREQALAAFLTQHLIPRADTLPDIPSLRRFALEWEGITSIPTGARRLLQIDDDNPETR